MGGVFSDFAAAGRGWGMGGVFSDFAGAGRVVGVWVEYFQILRLWDDGVGMGRVFCLFLLDVFLLVNSSLGCKCY